jgi:hypothetical protein
MDKEYNRHVENIRKERANQKLMQGVPQTGSRAAEILKDYVFKDP